MREIFQQSSYLFFAQVITRIIGFFYTIFLAQSLGVGGFGYFSVALAYFSIVSSFADFGFNRYLIREMAKEKNQVKDLVWNILILRLTLTSVLFAIFAVLIFSLDPDKLRVSLILLSILAIFPQSIALTFDAVFIALRKLEFSAVALFLSGLATTIAGLFLVKAGFGSFGAVNALIFGQLTAASVLALLYKERALILSAVNLSIIKKTIIGSLPYGILSLLGLIYFRIDTIMLSYLRGNFEAGIYGVGYKFLESLVFIPNALSFALFPAFAKLHQGDPAMIKNLIYKSTKIMFILGLLVTLAYLLFLPSVIKIFLPKFSQSIAVIQVLSLSIPFMFIHVPASAVLTSSEKYLKQIILISLIPLTFNIIANLIFIPLFGFMAASWVTVASDILSTLLLIIFIAVFFKND